MYNKIYNNSKCRQKTINIQIHVVLCLHFELLYILLNTRHKYVVFFRIEMYKEVLHRQFIFNNFTLSSADENFSA